MGKHIGTGSLARGKILGRLAFYTWVPPRIKKFTFLIVDFFIFVYGPLPPPFGLFPLFGTFFNAPLRPKFL